MREQTPISSCVLSRYSYLLMDKYKDVQICSVYKAHLLLEREITDEQLEHYLSRGGIAQKRYILFPIHMPSHWVLIVEHS